MIDLIFRDVPLMVECEFDAGEPEIRWGDNASPGAAAEAILIRCMAGGVDILPLLNDQAVAEIEQRVADELEAA